MVSRDLKIPRFKQCREWKEQNRIEEVDQGRERTRIKSVGKNQEKIYNLHLTITPLTALHFMKITPTIREEEEITPTIHFTLIVNLILIKQHWNNSWSLFNKSPSTINLHTPPKSKATITNKMINLQEPSTTCSEKTETTITKIRELATYPKAEAEDP